MSEPRSSLDSSTSPSLRRLKKYGLKDKSPTISEETIVVEKKDRLECCKTNVLIGRYIGLLLWVVICLGTFVGIKFVVYGKSGQVATRSKVKFTDESGRCPTPDKGIPYYYYYDEDGTIHCYWFAATPSAKKLDWWAANEECKRKMTYWNNADIGDTGKVEKKIVKSYLFIPETGDEFYRVVRHLIRLESHKILFQRPNLTSHGDAELWIGGRKCLYDYPIRASKYLDFHDYLWVPKDLATKKIPSENIFCQVGQIDHWYTHRQKVIRTETGDLTKKVNLSGECWDVMNERPQQRMSFLERPFNVWTNKFVVEDYNPLHKRILEMEESKLLVSYRNFFKEDNPSQFQPEEKKNCNFETYGLDNDDVSSYMKNSVPFCVNLATYADPMKKSSYNRDEEPEWTWYSYPCHWKSLYICEVEMETSTEDRKRNKALYADNRKKIQHQWEKFGISDPTRGVLLKD